MGHRTSDVYAVILVGGKGKRLRPLSTNARPKAFLSITRDRKTMFKVTLDRIKRLLPKENILVCANKTHKTLIRRDFEDINKENLILEPVSRNTAPAIGLAAAELQKHKGDAVMVILPADQYIRDKKKYVNAIRTGIEFAKDNDALVVLALRPTFPSTEFGYVKLSNQKPVTRNQNIYKIEKFVEKPDLKTAKRFVKDGGYFWNAGAFVFRASVISGAIKKYAPKIYACFEKSNLINVCYKEMPDISIDYAVMEHADNIYCVKGTYRWDDIGSFEALKKVLQMESRDFVERDGRIAKIL